MRKQGGFLVLSEIICDKFKQKKVNLHNGLNVILCFIMWNGREKMLFLFKLVKGTMNKMFIDSK